MIRFTTHAVESDVLTRAGREAAADYEFAF